MDREALRTFPTSWARRLAFGRDPRALLLRGDWSERQYQAEAPLRSEVAAERS
jgi:hypothetical protein